MPSDAVKKNKSLLITGASKGIGYATAKKFLSEGYQVINISRSPSSLPGLTQLSADLFQPDWIEDIREVLLQAAADADELVIVHNAALQSHASVKQLDGEQFRQVMELNVIAPQILNHLLLDSLKPGSAVLYVGSTLSLKATANVAAYVTSKHALVGLMRSTCQDLAGTGIHTACVCPGFTDTEMLRAYGGEVLDHLAAQSTQNRLIKPEEIADTLYFCATYPVVNGALLRADSGLIEH